MNTGYGAHAYLTVYTKAHERLLVPDSYRIRCPLDYAELDNRERRMFSMPVFGWSSVGA